jgi:hypothetical protein
MKRWVKIVLKRLISPAKNVCAKCPILRLFFFFQNCKSLGNKQSGFSSSAIRQNLPHQALNYLANGAAASCEASRLHIYQTTRCHYPQTIVNNNKNINLELSIILTFLHNNKTLEKAIIFHIPNFTAV